MAEPFERRETRRKQNGPATKMLLGSSVVYGVQSLTRSGGGGGVTVTLLAYSCAYNDVCTSVCMRVCVCVWQPNPTIPLIFLILSIGFAPIDRDSYAL